MNKKGGIKYICGDDDGYNNKKKCLLPSFILKELTIFKNRYFYFKKVKIIISKTWTLTYTLFIIEKPVICILIENS